MRFLIRRLALLLPVLFAVTAFSYLLLDLLPGDPALNILGPQATEENIVELRKDLNLDDPLPVRYVRWLGDIAHGDLGRSYFNHQPVTEALRQRIGISVELLIASQILALGLAVPLAIMAARRPGGMLDRASTGGAFLFLGIPNFVLGVILVFVFAVRLGWFPSTGLPPFSEDPGEHFRSLFLPAVSLAMAELAVYLRLLRTDMIATLQEDFILNARAKGMPGWYILLRHAFRPSSFSLLTVIGLNFGRLIGGALIIEVIFALPGMGSLAAQSIYSRDYLMVQGFVVIVAVGYVLINFAVDLLYAVLDPRIRHARAHS
jgi:peptide/nickel transport system permease protein